jgi:hypothetical protein
MFDLGRFLKYGVLAFAGFLLVTPGASVAWAHGGSGAGEQRCLINVGDQRVYYSGYRQGKDSGRLSANFQQFCEHIPSIGETLLVFDLEDEDLSDQQGETALRNLLVELRIVRGDGSADASQTLVHLPPQVYPQGSMEVTVNFDKLGRYTGILTVNGEAGTTAKFPIIVENPSGGGNWIMYGLALLGLVGGGGVLLFLRNRSKNKSSTA